jgi:hypothetical protein
MASDTSLTPGDSLHNAPNQRFSSREREKRNRLERRQRHAAEIRAPRRRDTGSSTGSLLTGVSRHEKLVLAYLNENLPLHVRRTLDQFSYYTLPKEKIRARDLDQVVWRYTKENKDPLLLMVDQLWLWVIEVPKEPGIDGETTGGDKSKSITRRKAILKLIYLPNVLMIFLEIVISAFPERWNKDNSWYNLLPDDALPAERTDMRFRILQAITTYERRINNGCDLAMLIMDKCTGIFHPRANETESYEKDFLDIFNISIGTVVCILNKALDCVLTIAG